MNITELSAILYYADYLSLQAVSQPVTDNCKYFFVHGCPMNSAFMLDLEPIYDTSNKYFVEAYNQYEMIKNKFDEDGVMSFVNDICFIRSCGMVDATRMLQHIHLFATNQERKLAFKEYNQWKNSLKYTITITDEDGNTIEKECSKYYKHAEEYARKQNIRRCSK